MYSPLYFYFEIRADASYSRSTDAGALKCFLSGLDALVAKSDDSYAAAEGAPWLSMRLFCADSDGNYASLGRCPPSVNLISVVGTKQGEGAAQQFYVDLMVEIASFLQWEVIDEEDVDGDENVVLWCPDESHADRGRGDP